MKPAVLVLPLALLTGCSWIGSAAKESVIKAAGYSSRAHFTLTGQIPADYSFKYTAYYQQKVPSCTYTSPGTGGHAVRSHVEQEETGTGKEPQTFRYRIPLAYHEGGCEMKLVNVDLVAFAIYGPGDTEFGRDGGSLAVYDTLPDSVPHFPASGSLELRGKCMWLFRLIGKSNSLVKILRCQEADAQWQVPEDYDQRSGVGAAVRRSELDGKTVRVEFRPSQEERPYFRGTWLNTEAGWKPCIETKEYLRCQNPPTFQTFHMDGHECTVYPNCTE